MTAEPVERLLCLYDTVLNRLQEWVYDLRARGC